MVKYPQRPIEHPLNHNTAESPSGTSQDTFERAPSGLGAVDERVVAILELFEQEQEAYGTGLTYDQAVAALDELAKEATS